MNKKKFFGYGLACLLPVILLCIAYARQGIWPFGDKTLLTFDFSGQYISFLSYFRDVLHGKASLTYSFSKSVGGSMLDIYAYYLASPLNLLFAFFSRNNIYKAILLLTLLRTALTSVFSFFYFDKKKVGMPVALLGSICYALSSYAISYQFHVMWMDSVALLPLILYGIDQIVEKKKFSFYGIMLGVAIFSNYYIGFMICIFCVIYFVYMTVVARKAHVKEFIFGSLLGGGLPAGLLVPLVYYISQSSKEFTGNEFSFRVNFTLADFVSKFFIGSTDTNQLFFGLPYVYCGTVVMVINLAYFIGIYHKTHRRERVLALLVSFFLFLSMRIDVLNIVWHGLNTPNGFLYRFSFVFIFFGILIAVKCLRDIETLHISDMVAALALILLASVWLDRFYEIMYLSIRKILVTDAIAFAVVILLILLRVAKDKKRLSLCFLGALVMITATDLVLNAGSSFKQNSYKDVAKIVDYTKSVGDNTVDVIKSIETSPWYRMEVIDRYNHNTPTLLNYKGVTLFSSAMDMKTFYTLENMGLREYVAWICYYNGAGMALDSLLGIKYIESKEQKGGDYTCVNTDCTIYVNPYAFPIGFCADEKIVSLELENDIPPENINSIYACIEKDSCPLKKVETVEVFNENGRYIYELNPQVSGDLMMYVPCAVADGIDPADVLVNNESVGEYFTESSYGLIKIGNTEKNTLMQVELCSRGGHEIQNPCFYVESTKDIRKAYETANTNQFQITSFKDNHIEGTYTAEEQKVLQFTIPYDECWQVTVDGKKVEPLVAMGNFLAIDTEAGEHEVVLDYRIRNQMPGILISAVSALLSILMFIFEHSRKKRRDIHEE